MATLLCFHAHPDDEAIATAGLMMRAAAAGHRVVLVVATTGELGLEPDDGLAPDESLADRRKAETLRSAEILGVHRTEFLGYHDSGMNGDSTNNDAGSFWQADVDDAARRLAALVADEAIDVLTIYDDHGGYDHPDHVQVHRVGTRFADLAGIDEVYWATMNRDEIARQLAMAADVFADDPPDVDTDTFGMPEGELTHAVDVGPFIERKRAAMRAHASQIRDDSFFLSMPDEIFATAFGTEWFHQPGARPGRASISIVIRP
jgi:LmbE family N-acetylglucosaminyl deacetylase